MRVEEGAVLLVEACNTEFEPLIRLDKPSLRRSRLSWVRQNYIRAETLTRAHAALVAAQIRIALARSGGDPSGSRVVEPGQHGKGRLIHAGATPRARADFGQVRKLLRPLSGLHPTFAEHLRKGVREKPAVPVSVRWDRRRAPAHGSTYWRYLADERRLPQAVIVSAIQAGVLREGPCASAWFAHHDPAGRLTGIEMRGPDFRGFSPGGDKSLFRLPGRPANS